MHGEEAWDIERAKGRGMAAPGRNMASPLLVERQRTVALDGGEPIAAEAIDPALTPPVAPVGTAGGGFGTTRFRWPLRGLWNRAFEKDRPYWGQQPIGRGGSLVKTLLPVIIYWHLYFVR